MEKIDLEKLGTEVRYAEYGAIATRKSSDMAIKQIAEKINEIIEYCNKNEEDKKWIMKTVKLSK